MTFFCIFGPFCSILAAFSLSSAHIKATYDALMDFFIKENYLEHNSGAICTIEPVPGALNWGLKCIFCLRSQFHPGVPSIWLY